MKKVILGTIAVLAVVATAVWVFRAPLTESVKEQITANMFVAEDTDEFDPGLPLGAEFPALSALHQGKTITDLRPFLGEAGMIVVANRSVDWCPYCMRQYIELEENIQGFAASGINVVAITYDTPELQQGFADQHQLSYPFLSDIDAMSMQAMQILHADYQPGDHHYGIPYPGVYVIDPDMQVVGKLFLEAYSVRVDGAGALAYAREVLTSGPPATAQ